VLNYQYGGNAMSQREKYRSSNLVVKSNELIESKYNLNTIQQKVVLYAITKIDRNSEKINVVYIDIKDYMELTDTTYNVHSQIKKVAESLIQTIIYIKDEDYKDYVVTSWLASAKYISKYGKLKLEFSEELAPYLLKLKEKFTPYQLENILFLNGKHSIRMYELLKQYEKIGKREFEMDDFKDRLMIKGYNKMSDLDKRVINPSIKEINEKTDILVTYTKVKKGKGDRVEKIRFKIKPKQVDEDLELEIKYHNQTMKIPELCKSMNLEGLNLNTKQVVEIYDLAITFGQDPDGRINPIEYIQMNYEYCLEKKRVKNMYSYLLAALKEDYAGAYYKLLFQTDFTIE
jgi:plasmid replication initiation protein